MQGWESDPHPIIPKTPPQNTTYRKKDDKEKTAEDKNGASSFGQ